MKFRGLKHLCFFNKDIVKSKQTANVATPTLMFVYKNIKQPKISYKYRIKICSLGIDTLQFVMTCKIYHF